VRPRPRLGLGRPCIFSPFSELRVGSGGSDHAPEDGTRFRCDLGIPLPELVVGSGACVHEDMCLRLGVTECLRSLDRIPD